MVCHLNCSKQIRNKLNQNFGLKFSTALYIFQGSSYRPELGQHTDTTTLHDYISHRPQVLSDQGMSYMYYTMYNLILYPFTF